MTRIRMSWTIGLILLGAACRPPEGLPNVADRPSDYGAAVHRLIELHATILARQVPAEQAEQVVQEQDQLVYWLPWLAADSDLAEAPWNRVAATADALTNWVDDLDGVAAHGRLQRYRAQANDWQAALDELDQIGRLLEAPPADLQTAAPEHATRPEDHGQASQAQEDPS